MSTSPDFEALAEVLLKALDEPEGLSPSALRRLRDVRRSAVYLLISNPSAYRDLSPDVLARDVQRLHNELKRSTAAIADPDLARQAAKREAQALDLSELVTVLEVAEILSTTPSAVERMVDDGVLRPKYTGHLFARDEVVQLAEDYGEAEAIAEEYGKAPAIAETLPAAKPQTVMDSTADKGPEGSPWVDLGAIESQAAAPAGPDFARIELHDAHAVGDDLIDGELYLDNQGRARIATSNEDGLVMSSLDGLNATRASELYRETFGPFTPARIVPADAIVLERPTTDQVREMRAAFPHLGGTSPATLLLENGTARVVLHVGCGSCDDLSMTRDQARTFAAQVAEAVADEAERGRG